jgi:methionyl-tRNA formyltransferase
MTTKVPLWQLVPELYYFTVMRLSTRRREVLNYSKIRSTQSTKHEQYLPPTITVSDINSSQVLATLNALKPKLIVVWGGSIIKPHIIETAEHALNIHTGYCPYYRGTNSNFNAILNDDLEHIGITIHDVVAHVDAGNIRALITADTSKTPRQFFTELNDKAFQTYLDIAKKIFNDEEVPSYPQNIALGKNYMLKEWTYAKQFRVTSILLKMESARKKMRAGLP